MKHWCFIYSVFLGVIFNGETLITNQEINTDQSTTSQGTTTDSEKITNLENEHKTREVVYYIHDKEHKVKEEQGSSIGKEPRNHSSFESKDKSDKAMYSLHFKKIYADVDRELKKHINIEETSEMNSTVRKEKEESLDIADTIVEAKNKVHSVNSTSPLTDNKNDDGHKQRGHKNRHSNHRVSKHKDTASVDTSEDSNIDDESREITDASNTASMTKDKYIKSRSEVKDKRKKKHREHKSESRGDTENKKWYDKKIYKLLKSVIITDKSKESKRVHHSIENIEESNDTKHNSHAKHNSAQDMESEINMHKSKISPVSHINKPKARNITSVENSQDNNANDKGRKIKIFSDEDTTHKVQIEYLKSKSAVPDKKKKKIREHKDKKNQDASKIEEYPVRNETHKIGRSQTHDTEEMHDAIHNNSLHDINYVINKTKDKGLNTTGSTKKNRLQKQDKIKSEEASVSKELGDKSRELKLLLRYEDNITPDVKDGHSKNQSRVKNKRAYEHREHKIKTYEGDVQYAKHKNSNGTYKTNSKRESMNYESTTKTNENNEDNKSNKLITPSISKSNKHKALRFLNKTSSDENIATSEIKSKYLEIKNKVQDKKQIKHREHKHNFSRTEDKKESSDIVNSFFKSTDVTQNYHKSTEESHDAKQSTYNKDDSISDVKIKVYKHKFPIDHDNKHRHLKDKNDTGVESVMSDEVNNKSHKSKESGDGNKTSIQVKVKRIKSHRGVKHNRHNKRREPKKVPKEETHEHEEHIEKWQNDKYVTVKSFNVTNKTDKLQRDDQSFSDTEKSREESNAAVKLRSEVHDTEYRINSSVRRLAQSVLENQQEIWTWDTYCQLQHSKGHCDKAMISYYYSGELDDCVEYIYSGCGGTKNLFETQKDCLKHCKGAVYIDQKALKSNLYCAYQPSDGMCMALFERYYYDINEQKCKQFIYGGCGGNQNRFDTINDCMASCGGYTMDSHKKDDDT